MIRKPLRLFATTALLCGLWGCGPELTSSRPPSGRLYFPTGIAHLEAAGSTNGFLYAASSNFDKRYGLGQLTAISLDALTELPALGAPVSASGPVQVGDLRVSENGEAYIQSFAGELGHFAVHPGLNRLFVPSRAEGDLLQIVDARGAALECFGVGGDDCTAGAPSLTRAGAAAGGKPRAPGPSGVGVAPNGEVYVTHLSSADAPVGTREQLEAYLVRVDANDPQVTLEGSFISLSEGGSSSVAVGSRHVFVSGRFGSPLVRVVDRTRRAQGASPMLETTFQTLESRGIALSPDETRLYLAGRRPDTLLVIDVQDAAGSAPVLNVVHSLPLPAGANQVRVIPRAGRGNLVAITCSTAGVLALYDEDVGQLVAQVSDLGSEPFGLAVDEIAPGARLFATNFGDGRIAVVDVPDLTLPHQARLVALLGQPQACLIEENCEEGSP